jgi:C4-dicarboxylate-specific signal transduction histidine kinase
MVGPVDPTDRDAAPGGAGDAPAEPPLPQCVAHLEARLRRRDAQRRALLLVLRDLHDANRRLALLCVLAGSGEGRSSRLDANRRAMSEILRDLRETSAEMRRREAKLRDTQEQLVQAGKLATLGELTTGVAHELNNPMGNIALFVGNAIDLLELSPVDAERVLRELQGAMQEVRKASEIVSHLRTFGRVAPTSRQRVSLRQVVERALSLVHEQLRHRRIEVQAEWRGEEAWVVGSAIQLEQVILNLLTNARDAVAGAPEKVIDVSVTVAEGVVAVVVRDSGPGIPAGLERRVFDPFFTTKDVGAGTGLGLSIADSIVREHEGTISVISRPGEGATFLVRLPLAPPPAKAGAGRAGAA